MGASTFSVCEPRSAAAARHVARPDFPAFPSGSTGPDKRNAIDLSAAQILPPSNPIISVTVPAWPNSFRKARFPSAVNHVQPRHGLTEVRALRVWPHCRVQRTGEVEGSPQGIARPFDAALALPAIRSVAEA